jgi:hypothetical protein
VEIELSKDLLKVYCKGKEISIHERQKGKGNFSTIQSHYPKYKRYSDSKEVVNLSCKRGIAFGVQQYQVIKNICSNGSYNLPLEFDSK